MYHHSNLLLYYWSLNVLLQSSCWRTLVQPPDFFAKCIKHPVNIILAENYERTLYFFDCKSIEFQNEKGDTILTKAGSGQMEPLPANVGVCVTEGKLKSA